MIVVMLADTPQQHIDAVIARVHDLGFKTNVQVGEEQTVVGLVGSGINQDLADLLASMPGVAKTLRVSKPYKLASKEFHPRPTIIRVADAEIGGKEVVVMAGPCSVENQEQVLRIAEGVRERGAKLLRGGAFKPRTSPYAFRGLGEQGLEFLANAREKTGLGIITEVMTPADVELVGQYTDVFQVGARNMQNYFLLEELGRTSKPVMLKRGPSGSIEEWLLAAEYIMAQGNHEVILCERGIRTFETATRNTFDINAVAYAKQVTHLPVFADPSHATGVRNLVPPMAAAAVAAGADGVIVEVHYDPDNALSDGAQTLNFQQFGQMMDQLRAIAPAVGRTLNPVKV
jgi:3-deoxy-7-phosphoheptulonate synthase